MPVVITWPGQFIGPGYRIDVQTDLIGPIGTDWFWLVNIGDLDTNPRGESQWSFRANGSHQQTIELIWPGQSYGEFRLHDGQQTHLQVQLITSQSTVEDESDSLPVTWDATGGLTRYLDSKPTAGGGMTQQEHDWLDLTQQNTTTMDTNWTQYEQVTLPSLNDVLSSITAAVTTTVTNATGGIAATLGQLFSSWSKDVFGVNNWTGGPTCDPIDADIGGTAYFGLELRITTRPDYFVGMTPDSEWTIGDMAVLRCYVGDELVLRQGIHMNTFSIAPLPGMLDIGVSNLGVPLAPPDYHIRVDWAMGVCGELLLQYIP